MSSNLQALQKIAKSSSYDPVTGNELTQRINVKSILSDSTTIKTWLLFPSKYVNELQSVSQLFKNYINEYERIVAHYATMFTYHSYIVGLNAPEEDASEEEKEAWKKSRQRCNNVLYKFNYKYWFDIVVKKIMLEGVYYAYWAESNNVASLIELPSHYVRLTGRWDLGWMAAIDLTFFDDFIGLEDVAPEIYNEYKVFIEEREKGLTEKELAQYRYMALDVNKFYAFTFDQLYAATLPPFRAIFTDALDLVDYKTILKQKAIIDTLTLLVQKVPLNKEANRPVLEMNEVSLFNNAARSVLPKGVVTFSTPMEPVFMNFKESQNFSSMLELGEKGVYQAAGVNGYVIGNKDSTSTTAIKASLQNDFAYIEHIYRQLENFINIRFFNESKKYIFKIKFFGDRYSDEANSDAYMKKVMNCNFPVTKLLAYEYDPYEIDGLLNQESILGIKDKLKPIVAQYEQPAEAGRPPKTDDELGDKGAETRDSGSNEQEKE